MTREIGSEFHKMFFDCGHGLTVPVPGHFIFSGRTAIETVLKELPEAKTAFLPSYCCDSMIQPFRDAGIEVEFYPVNYEDGLKIAIEKDADILLLCNYFGFNIPRPELKGFRGVVIEDVTHSLFSVHPYHPQTDYLVASLRKWEPINCGGYCAAVNGVLHQIPITTPPQEFIEKKSAAMALKTEYLSVLDEEKKPRFRSMFRESNHWLAQHYSKLSIDPWSREYLDSVDMGKQRETRRRNAKALYKGLKNAQFLFPEEAIDCPLFVPLLLPNRDEVRWMLTENSIYCPVHWPKPEGAESNLYERELSLICDQRYNEEDMERIVTVLKPLL